MTCDSKAQSGGVELREKGESTDVIRIFCRGKRWVGVGREVDVGG